MLDNGPDRRDLYGSIGALKHNVDLKIRELSSAIVYQGSIIKQIENYLSEGGTGDGTGGITGMQVPDFETDPIFTNWRDTVYEAGTSVSQTSQDAWNNALILDSAALFSYDADGGDSLWWYRGDGGFYTTSGTDRHLAPRIAWTVQNGQSVTGPYHLDGTFAWTHDGTSYPGIAHWLEIILYNVFGTLDNNIYTDYQALRSNPSTSVQSIIQRIETLEGTTSRLTDLEDTVGTRPQVSYLGPDLWVTVDTDVAYRDDFIVPALANAFEDEDPSSYTNDDTLEARLDNVEDEIGDRPTDVRQDITVWEYAADLSLNLTEPTAGVFARLTDLENRVTELENA